MSNSKSLPTNARPEVRFHDAMAAKWEGLHARRVFRSRTAAMFALFEFVPSVGQSWLDAGCGTGTLARQLASRGMNVEGIDASTEMISLANRLVEKEGLTDRLSFRQIETIESTPYDGNTFDGVLCASVLEYVPSPERCLAEFHRILRPHGLLVISIPNRQSLLRRTYKAVYGLSSKFESARKLRYLEFSLFEASIREMTTLLEKQGFVVRAHNFAGSPLPRIIDRQPMFGTLINIIAQRDDQ